MPTRRAGARPPARRGGRRRRILARIPGFLERLKQWLGGAARDAELEAEGGEPVATASKESERETSTNAQVAGASDEPWPGNE